VFGEHKEITMATLEHVGGGVSPAGSTGRLRRVAWLLVLVVGIVTYEVVLRVMIDTKNINFFPSLLLIGAITVPVSVLVFAETGGRTISVTAWVVAMTAIAGGVVGTIAAGTLEYETLRELGTVPMVLVGIIEEGAKLIVPFIVYLFLRPENPRAGVIIGIASGMGFATLETMGYGFQALLSAQSISAVDDTLLLRALLSPACHIAWTGMCTAMLWRIHSARHRTRAIAAFLGTYVVAVALHATWDGSTALPVHAVVAGIGLIVLLFFLHRAHRVPRAAVSPTPTTP
jgi:RsiW-degrading membrane proteinase PrsW (M82 family)